MNAYSFTLLMWRSSLDKGCKHATPCTDKRENSWREPLGSLVNAKKDNVPRSENNNNGVGIIASPPSLLLLVLILPVGGGRATSTTTTTTTSTSREGMTK